ncbi:biotin--[acetyl-CoA-carboxylase] ligase [Beijerinckia mobilis]|uniref:biotin--[acetyl-CoA-carboxylase] ligase n=1 Tax=Beijerinckia mobilis TaxID=231434 RepID=UPI00068BE845|nr:biotin--[acetyl-CoA-carboxylase] ligase [Beijerinckia mobilis]
MVSLFELGETALAQNFRLVHLEKVSSTNDEALKHGLAGEAGRLWVVADEQVGGRGRLGRVWSSPTGNLYASVLLIDPALPLHLPELGFVAGVAAAEAVGALVGDNPRLGIKWPNDLLFDGAKLAGILLETTVRPDGKRICVIGIGVNCDSNPLDTPYPATALAKIPSIGGEGSEPRAVTMFRHLSSCFAAWLEVWAEGKNFAQIRAKWLKYAAHLGQSITIARQNERIEGIFKTIDSQGRLILAGPQGEKVIEAGDVFLNAPP